MIDPKRMLPNSYDQEVISLLTGQTGRISLVTSEWDELLATIEREGMVGICYDSLRRSKLPTPVPSDILSYLEETYRKTQVKNVMLREELRSVLKRMNTAGIPVIALKGAALSELVYRDIGLRQMCDLDLLVRPEDTERAVSILQAANYFRISKPELQSGFDRLFRVEVELRSPPPCMHQVEIHWRLLAPLFACRFVNHSDVWERATPVNLVEQPAYTLGPEDWVLHQAAHAFYKHRHIGLRNLFDLDRLVRYLDQRLNWDKLLEIGRAFHWLPALAAVLPQCMEFFGTPIPEQVVQAALAYRLPRSEARMLAWWLHPRRLERSHIFPDWLTLPSLGDRLHVLKAYLFPGRQYLESLYPSRSTWKFPNAYLQHLWSEINSL